MTTAANTARKFWNAASFIRRAPDRDRTLALKALLQLSRSATGPVYDRAAQLLKDIHGTDKHSPRAG